MQTNSRLRRYWIKLSGNGYAHPLVSFGCGITAENESEALQILSTCVLSREEGLSVTSVIEDVDLRTLDAGHVLPNMLPPNWRGVWFPIGYDL